MTKTPIVGFDHPVIAVRDMNESRLRYERLGFNVPRAEPTPATPARSKGLWVYPKALFAFALRTINH
jgi:catechol 2,3-dioxygenase-like lactoylglutathione lyase family enzyme